MVTLIAMSKYSKKEIREAFVLVVILIAGVAITAEYLGSDKINRFKKNGIKVQATVVGKYEYQNYRKGGTTKEYVFKIKYEVNGRRISSDLQVDKDFYQEKRVREIVNIYYLKSRTQEVELQSVIDKK